MNDRIKELADQAKVTVLTTHGMENVVDGCYVTSPAQLEKFAELIVRECAKVLEIQGSNTGHEQYHYGASLIEEHFGVEE